MLGMLYMCAACALFPIMNGIVKLLATTYEPTQIVWFRIVVHLGLVALVFTPRMGLDLFRTQRIGLQFLSSVMMLLSTLFFFSAVKSVGVAEAIAVKRPISWLRPSAMISRCATIEARPIAESVIAMPSAMAMTPTTPAQTTSSAIASRITTRAPAQGAIPAAVSSSQPASVRCLVSA